MSVLRLTATRGKAIGLGLRSVEAATLVRRGPDLYLDIAGTSVPLVLRDLAYAGIGAEPAAADLGSPIDGPVGIGVDLVPVASAILEIVRLERIPLGAATQEVLRRRLGGMLPPGREARDRCRALLRGECVMFRWGRRVWAPRSILRTGRARSSIRPVVFDHASLDRWELSGRTCIRDQALVGWAFP